MGGKYVSIREGEGTTVARSEGHEVGSTRPTLASFADGGEEPQPKARVLSLETGKGKKTRSPLAPPEGTQPGLPLDPAQGDPCQPSNLWNCKVKQ